MHGNEPSGVIALQEVLTTLDEGQMHGEVLALVGNMEALAQNRRYIDRDLNRMWGDLQSVSLEPVDKMIHECIERRALWEAMAKVITADRPTYVIDLHTTSAESMPFMSMNSTAVNQAFAAEIPVPAVIGIEQHIKGPLLDLMARQGHVAVAYEASSHRSVHAVSRQKAMVQQVLEVTGVAEPAEAGGLDSEMQGLFGLVHREDISALTGFEMRPGFANFDRLSAGQHVADHAGGRILAPCAGYIFMPLYQSEGDDGFFIVNEA